MSYDYAAIKLRGPDALTNFGTPRAKVWTEKTDSPAVRPEMNVIVEPEVEVSSYESNDEYECVTISSPTSVLRYSEDEQCEPWAAKTAITEPTNTLEECQGETVSFNEGTMSFKEDTDFVLQDMPWDDVFHFPTFDEPVSYLFEETTPHFVSDGFGGVIDFEEKCSPSSLCQVDDYFSDILLGSDPLVAL